MPNLMQILSIFLKLQAVKQSGPGFLAYPVVHARCTGRETEHGFVTDNLQPLTCTSRYITSTRASNKLRPTIVTISYVDPAHQARSPFT